MPTTIKKSLWGHSMATLCPELLGFTQPYPRCSLCLSRCSWPWVFGWAKKFQRSLDESHFLVAPSIWPHESAQLSPTPACSARSLEVYPPSGQKQASWPDFRLPGGKRQNPACSAAGLWVSSGIILNYIGSHLFSTDARSWESYRASSSLLRKRWKRSCRFTDLQTSEDCPESREVWDPTGRGQLWAEETMTVAAVIDHGLWGTLP